MRKLILTCVSLAATLQIMLAQERQITGKVTSTEDGLPMIGVAVMDKQTMRGVATDADGAFSIGVSDRTKTLQFSYLGYKTMDVPISGNQLNVAMEPDLVAIDEVMVVAYGTGKKSTFTGSASVVKSESLEKIKTSNISQALQGQSSGVQVINSSGQPGDDATITIRGIGSMNASSEPLYVVDGVAYDGHINAINPADIETMTILKDASATALYGSRAANGVIMVTTKKGSSEKGQINFRSTWGFSSLAVDLPRALSPQEYTQLTWQAMRNGWIDKGYSMDEANIYATDNLKNELKINPFSIDKPVGLNGEMDPNAQLLFWGDWRDEILKSRLRQEYNLDFSGKNDKADYFLSGGYVKDKGIFAAQEFERYSLRSNLNYQVKKWLQVGTNTSLSHTRREVWLQSNNIWFLRTVSPTYPVYQWDPATGNYKVDGNGNRIYDFGDDRPAWTSWNPLADAEYNPSPETTNNISSRSYIEITFMPGLKFRTNFSVDHYNRTYDGYINPEYGYASGYGGEVSKSVRQNLSYTLNNLLTFDKSFGDHSISVLLGQEAYSMHYKYLYAAKRGLPFLGLTEIDSASEMYRMNSHYDKYRLLSYLSRVEYDYNDRYYLSASFRTDGSSRFHPDNRWGKFWSLGGSWRVSNEDFMSSYDWIDNLKLKASYGAVGNDKLMSGTSQNYYAYQGLYSTGSNDYNEAGVRVSRLANRDLKWESNMQFNVGLEFALFNKLSGSFEWFNRTSKDLLFAMPMPLSSGFSSISRNIGNVRNQGVEFQLNYSAINTRDFRWTIDLNGTSYKNKITKLPQEEINSGVFKWREGESRYNFWGIEYAGVNPETGNDQYWRNIIETVDGKKVVVGREKTEDYNSVTSDDHKKYLGDAIPKLFGGLTNSFSYKGIDLSFMIYYSIGGKLYDGDYAAMMSYRTGYSMHPDMLKGWSQNNPNADLPKISTEYASYLGTYTSKFLFNNSFARLRNVTLGYTLPKSFSSKFQVNSLRFFVQGDNVLTIGGASGRGTDPEQSISGETDNRFPATKSISFGLHLNL